MIIEASNLKNKTKNQAKFFGIAEVVCNCVGAGIARLMEFWELINGHGLSFETILYMRV